MAVTVGRIEYIVGADGRVLQKETRDAARKAGKTGGKVYSDEMLESFRKKWAGGGGFAKTLEKEDQRIVNQFRKLGGFTSKAYADKFEKTIVPAYRQSANKMIKYWESLKFDPLNGITAEMQRLFGNSEDLNKSLRRMRSILDDLRAGKRLGFIEQGAFDIGGVNKLRNAIQDLLDTGDTEILTKRQREYRDSVVEATDALEKALTARGRHVKVVDDENRAMVYQQHIIQTMIRDRGALSEVTKGLTRGQSEFTEGLKPGSLQNYTAFLERYHFWLDKIGHTQREAHAGLDLWSQGLAFARGKLGGLGTAVEDTEAKMTRGARATHAFGDALSTLGDKLKNLGNRGDLTPRVIVAIVAALGEPIAALSSAAGGGLLVLAGGATAAAIGLGTMFTAITVLNDPLSKLPANLRRVAAEYQAFTKVAGGLRLNIAAAAFSQMEGTFPRFALGLQALTPAFQDVARVGGKAMDDLSRAVLPGSKAFAELNLLIEDSAPLLKTMSGTVGTFSLAFVEALNRANPLVSALVGWIDKLATRFSQFVNGPGFGDWLGHTQAIFASLSPLLDTVSRTLNNLVTDESIKRTTDFIDNLTSFIPAFGELITTFGELNILTLVAQLLDELGTSLAPLVDPMQHLARVISVDLQAAIEGFGQVLSFVAPFLAAWVSGVASLLGALPPPLVASIAAAVGLLAVSLSALVAISGISKLAGDVVGLISSLKIGPVVLGSTGKLLGMLGKAGLVGAAIVGVGLLANALTSLAGAANKAAPGLNLVVRGITEGNLEAAFGNADAAASSFSKSLELIDGTSFDATMERFGEGLGNVFGVQGIMTQARDGVSQLDAALAQLVSSGSADQAAEAFDQLAVKAQAQGVSVSQLKDLFPQYADALAGAVEPTQRNVEVLDKLQGQAQLTGDEIDSLSDQLKNFGQKQLDVRSTGREMQQSIIDLTAKLLENGGALDGNSQAALDDNAAIDDLIGATNDHAAAVFEQTGNQAEANKVLNEGRTALYNMYKQFDPAGLAAGKYNDVLDLIPTDITTVVKANTAPATAVVESFIRTYNGKTIYFNVKAQTGHVAGSGVSFQAAGGIATSPRHVIFGEAGPEALVPLRRPLSKVDPSVRALSAFAQGMSLPRMAGGGVSGGRTLNIAPGAITIQGSLQPEAAATNVVNRIAERLGG